jgi:hypothetical protein
MRTENCCGITRRFYPAGQAHKQRLPLNSSIRLTDHKTSGKMRFPPGQKRGESTSKSGLLKQSPASRLRSTQCSVCYAALCNWMTDHQILEGFRYFRRTKKPGIWVQKHRELEPVGGHVVCRFPTGKEIVE